ncbi:VCBS repeat-containing protein, partial [Saprospiraceae bacterium]|nr:VCBS repeat-containing protein [Saprospiraceae bacterium]
MKYHNRLPILFLLFSLFFGNQANAQLGSKRIIGECDTCEPNDLSISDFDGDGLADVVVVYYNGPVDLVWLKNLGEEGFDEPQIIIESASRGLHVKSADLDNDGDQDLVVSSVFPSKIEYLLNDGLGNFSAPILLTENIPNPSLLELADLNDDGFLDFFTSDSGLDDVLVMYNNNGVGFTAQNYPVVQGSRVYKAADLDQDGDLDLIGASSRFIQWIENTGNGFAEREILITYPANNFVSALQVYDMDDDGDLDFLMAHNSDRIFSSKNDGTGAFSEP